MENMIKDFLRSSIKNDFGKFDFERFFEEFEPILKQKLTEHGLTSFEDYMEFMEGIGDYSDADLEKYELVSDYVSYTVDDVREAIVRGQYEACRLAFSGMFDDLQILYDKISQYTLKLPLQEKIILVDECIHAEHCHGNVLDNLNQSIDEIKDEIDKEYADGLIK